jgi:MazG family protein
VTETRSAAREGLPQPVPLDDPRLDGIRLLLGTVDRLRGEGGCPWDRAQTLETMGPHLVEEAMELVDAVEDSGDVQMAEEAGDALMVLLLMANIGAAEGRFDLTDVTSAICAKLIRRHPHVFGEEAAASPGEALKHWEAAKRKERSEAGGEDTSALASVPKGLPALQRAHRICGKAVAAGFAWPNVGGALAKVEEELAELLETLPADCLDHPVGTDLPDGAIAGVSEDLGDLILAAAFLGRYLGLDPEALCRRSLRRFEVRFRTMETELAGDLANRDLEVLLAAWERAKG